MDHCSSSLMQHHNGFPEYVVSLHNCPEIRFCTKHSSATQKFKCNNACQLSGNVVAIVGVVVVAVATATTISIKTNESHAITKVLGHLPV